MKENSILH